jgi:hypothetical protein
MHVAVIVAVTSSHVILTLVWPDVTSRHQNHVADDSRTLVVWFRTKYCNTIVIFLGENLDHFSLQSCRVAVQCSISCMKRCS